MPTLLSKLTGPSATPQTLPSVAVVITTYNHAHYLGEAIDSVMAQSRPADELIVVDDGSTDDPADVVAKYPGVRLIHQANQGLSAARNVGLAAAEATYILFLDADDRLLPRAIAAGLEAFAAAPGAAFVYGAHRRIDAGGAALGPARYEAVGDDPFAALLRGNLVAMHATVLYARTALAAAGGFDAELRRCEDYDVYLRLARGGAVVSYSEPIAEYRWHDTNMSHDHRAMLKVVLAVHERQRAAAGERAASAAAWRDGRRNWTRYYANETFEAARGSCTAGWAAAVRVSPRWAASRLARAVLLRFARVLGSRRAPPVGRVDLGDLATTRPISVDFGFDRGLPVDRHYVEAFLSRSAADIGGRVLEVGDDEYSRRFGGRRVTRQEILHVHAGNPRATIVGDLSDPGVLPEGALDCIVLTQTLHLIYDMPRAVERLWASLRPGGVLLVTVPGISQIDRGEWGASWFWSLTPAALSRLLSERFGADNVEVEAHGNVLTATAFLQGLAAAEIGARRLDVRDEAYPVIVAARARRAVA